MSLSALTWKKGNLITPASSSVPDILNAIYTAFTATTYYNGATRTAGSGSAWTAGRYQNSGTTEAVYLTPPSGTLNQRVIFAAKGTSATPTMATPDTFATNTIIAAIAKNAGAYNAWDAAAPFTSGQFYGYWRCVSSTTVISYVQIIESADAIIVCFIDNTSFGNIFPVLAGGFIDPQTSSSLSAESNGLRYGLFTGNNAISSTNFLETATAWPGHSGSSALYHGMVADVGAVSTFSTIQRMTLATGTSTTWNQNANSEYLILSMYIGKTAGGAVGTFRQIGIANNGVSGTTLQDGSANPLWHLVGQCKNSSSNRMAFQD